MCDKMNPKTDIVGMPYISIFSFTEESSVQNTYSLMYMKIFNFFTSM